MHTSPSLATVGAYTAGLPVELTTFIGRASELDQLERLLSASRMLTLTGAGGSGKTRLGLELAARVAESYQEGVAWVELAGLSESDLLPRQLVAALGIREEHGTTATEALVTALCNRSLLLVLDNCEHLAEACAALAETLLRGCPGLKLLATSREALGVAGERAWLVPALSLPDTGAECTVEQLARFEAVQLFLARAQDVSPSFQLSEANGAAVVKICQRLDGIPLAIELAAARVRVLAPEQIIKRLDNVFAVLTSSRRMALPRHRTLRATMEWSYQLLAVSEQLLLQRLSVFAGGFTLEAAETVCADEHLETWEVLDLVARLVDRSLVMMREKDGAARYHLLETVRQYAHQQLSENGDADAVQHRHSEYFVDFAESAEPHLVAGAGSPRWVVLVDDELSNLRAASEWLLREKQAEAALRLLAAIHWYWFARGGFEEGRTRLEAAVAVGSDAAPLVRAKAHSALAMTAIWQGDHTAVPALLAEAIPLLRGLNEPHVLAYALTSLGCSLLWEHPMEANAILEEAVTLSRTGKPNILTAVALYWAGFAAQAIHDDESARNAFDEAIALGRALDHKPGIAHPLTGRGRIAILQRDYARASSCFAEALRIHHQTEDRWGAIMALEGLGQVADEAEQPDRAARLLGAATAIRRSVGVSLPENDRPEHERLLRKLQGALGAGRFATCFSAGEAATFDAIVEYAVQLSDNAVVPGGGSELASSSASDSAVAGVAESTTAHARPHAALDVLALGPLEIYREGELLPADAWPYAKPRELLVFLLLHPSGRTREQIGCAIWPGASPGQVRNSFHVTLHHLRKTLGGPDWIVNERDRYRFSPAVSCELDANRFEREAREILKNPGAGAAELRGLLALYRGDLLEGEVAGPWIDEHRDRLHALRVELGLALGDVLEEQGDHAGAAEIYYGIVAREDLNEEAHRRLMRTWARSGDRVRALRHYDRLVTLLRDEVNAEPEPETVQVYEGLRRIDAH